MSVTAAIDLSQLPPPDVVEPLDYETILAAIKADLIARDPTLEPVLAVESEPVTKLCEAAALRELLLRQRINDAVRANMLAYATGADLDNLAARYDVVRLPDEGDERLRARVLLAYHAISGAGSDASWRFRAFSVDADVRQADVWSPTPGRVRVAVLARVDALRSEVSEADQAIGDALFGAHRDDTHCWRVAVDGDDILARVRTALTDDTVKPLTVDVDIVSAEVLPYQVSATVIVPTGIDATTVLARARARLESEAAGRSQFRVDVHRSAISGALMGPSVRDVILQSPSDDLRVGNGQISAMTSAAINFEVRRD